MRPGTARPGRRRPPAVVARASRRRPNPTPTWSQGCADWSTEAVTCADLCSSASQLKIRLIVLWLEQLASWLLTCSFASEFLAGQISGFLPVVSQRQNLLMFCVDRQVTIFPAGVLSEWARPARLWLQRVCVGALWLTQVWFNLLSHTQESRSCEYVSQPLCSEACRVACNSCFSVVEFRFIRQSWSFSVGEVTLALLPPQGCLGSSQCLTFHSPCKHLLPFECNRTAISWYINVCQHCQVLGPLTHDQSNFMIGLITDVIILLNRADAVGRQVVFWLAEMRRVCLMATPLRCLKLSIPTSIHRDADLTTRRKLDVPAQTAECHFPRPQSFACTFLFLRRKEEVRINHRNKSSGRNRFKSAEVACHCNVSFAGYGIGLFCEFGWR